MPISGRICAFWEKHSDSDTITWIVGVNGFLESSEDKFVDSGKNMGIPGKICKFW